MFRGTVNTVAQALKLLLGTILISEFAPRGACGTPRTAIDNLVDMEARAPNTFITFSNREYTEMTARDQNLIGLISLPKFVQNRHIILFTSLIDSMKLEIVYSTRIYFFCLIIRPKIVLVTVGPTSGSTFNYDGFNELM